MQTLYKSIGGMLLMMVSITAAAQSEVTLLNDYRWDNGLRWNVAARYAHSRGAMVYQTPMALIDLKSQDNQGLYDYRYRGIDGSVSA